MFPAGRPPPSTVELVPHNSRYICPREGQGDSQFTYQTARGVTRHRGLHCSDIYTDLSKIKDMLSDVKEVQVQLKSAHW